MCCNKYETEIYRSKMSGRVCGNVKYKCGYLAYGWERATFKEVREKIRAFINRYPFIPHENCDSEYCKQNKR
jgi:hypothetical protein